jgi:hypothetical protein
MRDQIISDDFLEFEQFLCRYTVEQDAHQSATTMPQMPGWEFFDQQSALLATTSSQPNLQYGQRLSPQVIEWLDSLMAETLSPMNRPQSHSAGTQMPDEEMAFSACVEPVEQPVRAVYWLESVPLPVRTMPYSPSPMTNGRIGIFVRFLEAILNGGNDAVYWLDRGVKVFKVNTVISNG